MKRLIFAVFILLLIVPAWTQELPTLAVLDFELEEVSEKDMQLIVSLLSSAIFQTGKYTVIESAKRDVALDEMKFSASGLTDSDSIREIGRLLSAQGLVVGNLGKVGTRFILSTKLLETETAKTMASADGVYTNLDDLLDDIKNIAGQLAGIEGVEVAQAPAKTETVKEDEKEPVETLPLVDEEPKRVRKGKPGVWLALGGAALAGGGTLMVMSPKYKTNTVDAAYDDYMNGALLWPGPEPFSSLSPEDQEVYYAELYDTYLKKLTNYKIMSISGANLAALGGVFTTVGVIKLIGKKPDNDVSFGIGTRDGLLALSVQVRR